MQGVAFVLRAFARVRIIRPKMTSGAQAARTNAGSLYPLETFGRTQRHKFITVSESVFRLPFKAAKTTVWPFGFT